MAKLTITKGQLKDIAIEVNSKFELKNSGTYYNVINRKTRESSLESGSKSSGSMFSLIRHLVLNKANIQHNQVLDWQTIGVSESQENLKYLFKCQSEIVRMLCGFTFN